MSKIKSLVFQKISGNERLLIFLSVAVVAIGVTGFAMTIDSFTDYKPPTSLIIQWADYYVDAQHTTTTSNNEKTEWTRYTVDYPYRAVFYGGSTHASSTQGHDSNLFVVYSKQPATDLFTFSYRSGAKSTNQTGYIRAFVPRLEVGFGKDIMIVRQSWNGIRSDYEEFGYISNFAQYDTAYNSVLIDGVYQSYFDFDFFYECAVEHGENSKAFNISGLSDIDVPYSYILECENHGTSGGSSSGGNSGGSGGSSSSGSSSSGGSGGSHNYPSNNKGNKGRNAWGKGEFGGGVDDDEIDSSAPSVSVPDDVFDEHEDDYNRLPSGEYSPDYPPYVPAEGDTGNNGSSWSLPELDINNDGVSGTPSGFITIDSGTPYGLIDFMSPLDTWGK